MHWLTTPQCSSLTCMPTTQLNLTTSKVKFGAEEKILNPPEAKCLCRCCLLQINQHELMALTKDVMVEVEFRCAYKHVFFFNK